MGQRRRWKGLPAGAKKVRDGIEHWRRTRTKRWRMPEPLWDEAVALARVHGVYRISQVLRVNYDSLKTRVARTPKAGGRRASGPPSPSGFVELSPMPAGVLSPSAGTVVEVLDTKGTRLTIRLAAGAELDIAALMSAFCGGPR